MKSLGIPRKELYPDSESPVSIGSTDKENPTCYPSLYIEPKFLTKMGLDEFEPGDRIKIEIEVVIREQTIRKNEKGKETISQQLDLCSSGKPEKVGTGEPEDSEETDESEDETLGYKRDKKKPKTISAKEALGD